MKQFSLLSRRAAALFLTPAALLVGVFVLLPFFWVIVVSASALSLGTAVGGWRIMRTMGHRVVQLEPVHGFAAETTAATVLIATAHFGMPVSTTHVISSAIMGVGSARGPKGVRWGVARRILLAWVITIPATALVAGVTWFVLHTVGFG